jgi:hypothetical protein
VEIQRKKVVVEAEVMGVLNQRQQTERPKIGGKGN